MKGYSFKNNIYKGNIDRDFYLFCLWKKPRIFGYLFFHILFCIIGLLSFKIDNYRMKTYHKYLKKFDNIDLLIDEFYSKYKRKINKNYVSKKNNMVFASSPKILVQKFLRDEQVLAVDFTDSYELNFDAYNKNINQEKKMFQEIFYSNFSDVGKFEAEINYIKKSFIKIKLPNMKVWKALKKAFIILLIILLSYFLLLMTFTFTSVYIDKIMINSYFKDKMLLLLNFIPILICILFLLLLTKRLWLSFSITSFIIIVIGIANKTKLLYRDDVVKIEDFLILKEALLMTKRYALVVRWYTVVCIFLCIGIAIFLKKNIKKINLKRCIRVPLILVIIFSSIYLFNNVYTSEKLYKSVGDETLINIWLATRMSQIRGLVYPLIYSSTEMTYVKPDGYDAKEAALILDSYDYDDIPQEEKINIIGIMLEAFNDFSQFETIKFRKDAFAGFNDVKKRSISGKIIVNVIGGGTIDTERKVITGFDSLPTFRKPTNSYAWYFKEQGYFTESNHPCYGTFYNRNTINLNLGYEKYWNYENKYNTYNQTWFAEDSTFFKTIYDQMVIANDNDQPYFNMSVTYQNHGPYNTTGATDDGFTKRDNLSDSAYNMFNNYLFWIKRTSDSIKYIVDLIEEYDKPTIIFFFGDHNPYLGENSYVFKELGINMELSTEEGFENYYSTPYLIYGNSEAKKVFQKSFVGNGPTISQKFLMNELFSYLGWGGNEYMKYTTNLSETINVIHPVFNKVNGKYVKQLDQESSDKINEYKNVSYYYSTAKVNN